MKRSDSNLVLTLLRYLCFFLFLGRAWQHIRWDAPFRALLWDQNIMEGFVTKYTNYEWSEWIRSPEMDSIIQGWIEGFGWFYLFCAIVVLLVRKTWPKKIVLFLFAFASLSLIVLALLYCKEKFYHGGQFLEYAIQFSLPLLFYFALFKNYNNSSFKIALKVAIASTFFGHGLYALGYYPVPGNFVQMTLSTFPFLSEQSAYLYLKIAGVLDLVCVVAIFFPKLTKPALYYCIIWGFLTALARVVANFYGDLWLDSLDQWLPETLYRLGHGGVPLVLLLILNNEAKEE